MNALNWTQLSIEGGRKQISARVAWQSSTPAELPQDIERIRQLCADGCPHYNRNGGCPPWSPTIEALGKEHDLTLLAVSAKASTERPMADMNDAIDDWMDKLGYAVLDSLGVSFLSAGPCRACQTCTIETGCKDPNRRVSSITGVGLLLSDILEHHFQQPLQWSKGDQQPEHLTKVMGFLHKPEQTKALDEFLRRYITT